MKQFLISYTRSGSDMISTVNAETAEQASAYFFSVKADAQIIDCREDSTNYARRGVPSYTVPEGWTAEPENPISIAECMKQAYGTPKEDLSAIGQKGFEYAISHFSKTVNLAKLVSACKSVIDGRMQE